MFKILLVIFSFLTVNLCANGSPIDFSSFKKAGQIEPKQLSDVSLLRESLYLRIFKDWVQVKVIYTLSAPSSSGDIAYAFPLNIQEGYAEDSSESENEFEAVRGIAFTLDGKRLPHAIHFVPGEKKGTIWATTSLPLIKRRSSILQVEYLVRSELDDNIFTKSFKPRFGERAFTYSFALAKNWGKSQPDINVTVDATQVLLEGGKFKKVLPKPHAEDNGLLSWTWTKADLSTLDDLVFEYDRSESLFREYIETNREFINPWILENQKDEQPAYRFRAPEPISSTHPWTNLFDRSPRKAYAVKWTGKPLRINLTAPSIHGIGVLNGYLKDEASYLKNARIRAGKVEIQLPGFAKLFSESEDLREGRIEEFKLPNRPWKDFDPIEPWRSLDWIVDIGDVPGPMVISITITDVYPGTTHQDLCLSEVFLVK